MTNPRMATLFSTVLTSYIINLDRGEQGELRPQRPRTISLSHSSPPGQIDHQSQGHRRTGYPNAGLDTYIAALLEQLGLLGAVADETSTRAVNAAVIEIAILTGGAWRCQISLSETLARTGSARLQRVELGQQATVLRKECLRGTGRGDGLGVECGTHT